LKYALNSLYYLDAIDIERKITDIGALMIRMPSNVEIARMLVAGVENNCEWMVCSLASILSGN